MHTSRYSLQNKKNVQYQLLELVSRFDEDLLQRAETFNMNSFIYKIKTHFINQYEVNYIGKLLCLCTCLHINLIHFLFLNSNLP